MSSSTMRIDRPPSGLSTVFPGLEVHPQDEDHPALCLLTNFCIAREPRRGDCVISALFLEPGQLVLHAVEGRAVGRLPAIGVVAFHMEEVRRPALLGAIGLGPWLGLLLVAHINDR